MISKDGNNKELFNIENPKKPIIKTININKNDTFKIQGGCYI